MIDKVIIAEDHESLNLSVQKTVEDMHIAHVDYVYYCDDALKKIGIAKHRNEPYDLLITDLSFESDGTSQTITTGQQLISAAREIQPELCILVFSVEKAPAIIDELFEKHKIDGYVLKGRHDTKELKLALEAISKRQQYYPRALSRPIKPSHTFSFTDFDVSIIRLLAQGYQQNQIPDYLRKHKIRPSSLSSIEKRLNQIRAELGFSKNEQLVLYCKDARIL